MKTSGKINFVIIGTILLISLTPVGLNAQENARQPSVRPAFRMTEVIKSAEILPDNSVTFRLLSNLSEVCLINTD